MYLDSPVKPHRQLCGCISVHPSGSVSFDNSHKCVQQIQTSIGKCGAIGDIQTFMYTIHWQLSINGIHLHKYHPLTIIHKWYPDLPMYHPVTFLSTGGIHTFMHFTLWHLSTSGIQTFIYIISSSGIYPEVLSRPSRNIIQYHLSTSGVHTFICTSSSDMYPQMVSRPSYISSSDVYPQTVSRPSYNISSSDIHPQKGCQNPHTWQPQMYKLVNTQTHPQGWMGGNPCRHLIHGSHPSIVIHTVFVSLHQCPPIHLYIHPTRLHAVPVFINKPHVSAQGSQHVQEGLRVE